MGERDGNLASPPAERKPPLASRCAGAIWGSFIGDALAMPVHWYYDVAALRHDYGVVRDYLAPRNPHPDSYLSKARYHPVNAKAEILHDQAKYWGRPGIHYHQFLRRGENTLNLKLAAELLECLADHGRYDPNEYLARYLAFMLTPGRHHDTYIESAHRAFFQNYARGRDLFDAAIVNPDIGGLVALPGLIAGLIGLGQDEATIMAAVRQHLSLTHRGTEIEQAAQDLNELMLHLLRGADWSAEIHRLVYSRGLELESLLGREDSAVVGGIFSAGCPVTGSFPAILYLGLKYFPNFEQALVANTNLGGDNCHRGAVLGAIMGAALGQEAIPDRWLNGLLAHDRLRRLINKLCEAPPGN